MTPLAEPISDLEREQLDMFAMFPTPEGLVVDLFAGGGGASTGILWALGRHPDDVLNHSLDALRNHALNHPEPGTRHHVDDIRLAKPLAITRGRPVDLLWASPDCRDFSRAKGGKPCHPKVRSLAKEITRWARETRPRAICMENVWTADERSNDPA